MTGQESLRAAVHVTPEELAERGWEGVSRCRCDTDEGYTACPPQMCGAQDLLDELAHAHRLHGIAVGLLTDAQMAEYRRLRDA